MSSPILPSMQNKQINAFHTCFLTIALLLSAQTSQILASEPKDIRISNNSSDRFTISWLTETPVIGKVRYGTTTALGEVAHDIRGAGHVSTNHYVTIVGLDSDMPYHYDIVSGAVVDDNGGTHYAITSGAFLSPLTIVDFAFGDVFLADGTTPAVDSIVYMNIKDNDAQGTQGISQLVSLLITENSTWFIDLKKVRTVTLDSYFLYTDAGGDQLVLEALGIDGDDAFLLVGASDGTPIGPMILTPNQAPVLNSIGDKTVNEGVELLLTISATDPDGDAATDPHGDVLTFSASNLPSGASFDTATHIFSWTPTFNQAADYLAVRFEVSDGVLNDFEEITITVVDVDITPPVTTQDYDGQWHQTNFTINLSATDLKSTIQNTFYKLNGGATQTVSVAGQPQITQEGNNHTLEFWSVDAANNEESPHPTLSGIKLDKTAPTVDISSPQSEAAFTETSITITGTVSDTLSGVDDLEIDVEGAVFNPTVAPQGTFTQTGVTITGGPNVIQVTARDVAGNTAQLSRTVFQGWVLHLTIPYHGIETSGSGAATAQMILNYMRDGVADTLTQDTLYTYGHPFNLNENSGLSEMDPRAIQYALGHFDPYDTQDPKGSGDSSVGYSFEIQDFESNRFTEYLRDIIHWMAYPVTVGRWWQSSNLVQHPETPAALPALSSYDHWIVVNGAAASEDPIPEPHSNPWLTPDFTVYGLWLTDPASQGIGQDLYVTAQIAQSTYLLPLTSSDRYNGMFVQVAEPPLATSQAEVTMAGPQVNPETLKIIEIAEKMTQEVPPATSAWQARLESVKRHLYDAALVVQLEQDAQARSNTPWTPNTDDPLQAVFDRSHKTAPLELDWQKIVDSALLTDHNFRKAFEGSQARSFVKVRRIDHEDDFYYLIPFDKYEKGRFLTYAALLIDAREGYFEQASWSDIPTHFVPLKKAQAEALFNQHLGKNYHARKAQQEMELVWEPNGLSSSPFYPYWRWVMAGQMYWMTQDGVVHEGVPANAE